MIKYLGSKRRLVPVLGRLLDESGAQTALDLFTGTTRVAQEFKRHGAVVTAVDLASYSDVFARCWIGTDAGAIDTSEHGELHAAIGELNALEGTPGYVTETFCHASRFFQPKNGARIDAIRDAIEDRFAGSPLHPILLTSLIVAADKVDSTTGVQMAYLKQWAPRSYADLQLMMPELIAGAGHTVRGDAHALAGSLGDFDLAYLDPPYNNHRYFTNYHIFETLVTWDRPDHYGVACKRTDSRSETTRSVFNAKRSMPSALAATIAALRAGVVIVSYNNESWLSLDDLRDMCRVHGHVEVLAFDSKRYIGAQIGIHNPAGQRVGQVSHLHNLEYVVIAGPRATVTRMAAAFPTAHLST